MLALSCIRQIANTPPVIDETSAVHGADFKPRAFKWHASRSAMTNWNPLRGRVSDHFMDGYLNALHSHKHSGKNCAGEKPWVSEYDTTQ